ncbi:protein sel-1 homolog 3 [Brachyhypopomus gauderio]|uniref:protein sel-1 homolog 3 n=1 Tax=Brachyhypopomus gauderio TaxID=698409 RepID=UPI0040424450
MFLKTTGALTAAPRREMLSHNMKVYSSSSFVTRAAVYSAILCVIQGEISARTTNSSLPSLDRSHHGDFVQFDVAPDVVAVTSSVLVNYTCSRSCRVGLEAVLNTPQEGGRVAFRRSWTHLTQFGKRRRRRVVVTFPPAVVYARDFFVRRPVEVRDVMLRAWLVHLDAEERTGGRGVVGPYHQSLVRTFKVLQAVPLSERTVQPRTRSVAWGVELLWNLTKDRLEQCAHDSAVVDVLAFPFASSGERFGVIRTLHPFTSTDLERARVRGIQRPRVTLSVWLYLLNQCGQKQCGIIRHVTEHRTYGTPLIMINKSGRVVVQMSLVSREEQAFTAHTVLPVRTWTRLDLFFHTSMVKLVITYVKPAGGTVENTHSYEFSGAVLYNDTSGYFAIGGDVYMPGIHGYFGPIKYYRLGSEKVENPLSPSRTLNNLDRIHRECEEMRGITADYLRAVGESSTRPANDVCEAYSEGLRRSVSGRCVQTWSWDQQRRHSTALQILKTHQELISGQRSSRRAELHLSQHLFKVAVKKLSTAVGEGPGAESGAESGAEPSLMELLQLSSCWGHQQASLMLATLHLSGIGLPADQEQGHVHSLMGGAGDRRMDLLHLGYKHMQGLDGFPKDQDMSCAYYSNVGQQTSLDRDKVLDSEQSLTEHVHLTHAHELQTQTGDTGDLVQFLKLQAEGGDVEAQKTLARMLFWGSNGVMKDISAALRWYARSALQMNDPTAMYDYGILLLKGTGMKKNQTLGLKLLKKAADMGSADALNGLGWYYSTAGQDDRKAVNYFELAAQNGSRDGVFNLGVYHLNGADPDKPGKNETAAFQCFLAAGEQGHVEGAVEAAALLCRGGLRGVARNPGRAVTLLKKVSEKNGHLGFTIREALKAYQQGSWDEALVKYAMIAETGLVVAQYNAAYLCEVLKHGSACHWRYHNYSTYNHAPHEAGLLKMGDYYSEEGDMVKAIALYSRAALEGSPQGLYNLAVLTEAGYSAPSRVLEEMQFQTDAHLHKSAVVEGLLLRCRSLEGQEDELGPCSLALLWLRVRGAWRAVTSSPVKMTLSGLALTALALLLTASLLQHALPHLSSGRSNSHPRQSPGGTIASAPDQQALRGTLQASETQDGGSPVPSRVESLAQRMNQNSHWLQEATDMVITATGVCICALCMMFVSHLL